MEKETSATGQPLGNVMNPDPAWVAKHSEPALEPELPIVDTHHHLWDMPGFRYMLDDFLADTGTGHNIVATVFNECQSMYRAGGPKELRPVGEVEFINGIAAQAASGQYGKHYACAGIIGARLNNGVGVAGASIKRHTSVYAPAPPASMLLTRSI